MSTEVMAKPKNKDGRDRKPAGRKPIPAAQRLVKASYTLRPEHLEYLESHAPRNDSGQPYGMGEVLRDILDEYMDWKGKKSKS